jgi:hypothetical protein
LNLRNLRELSLACNKTFLKTVVDNCLLYRALHHASPSNLSSNTNGPNGSNEIIPSSHKIQSLFYTTVIRFNMKYHFPSSSNPLWWSSLLGVASFRSSTTVARSFADTIAHGTDKVYEQRKNAKRIHLQTRRHNALSSTIISFQTTPGKEPDPKDILHFKVRSYLLVLIMFMFVFTFYFTVHSLTSIHFQLMTGMQQRFRSRIWLQA